MLTGEFEREAEQNANGTEKVPNDSPDLTPCNTVSDTIGTSLISDESMVSISQFTEKFLEQNLSKYMYMNSGGHLCRLGMRGGSFEYSSVYVVAYSVTLNVVDQSRG